MLAVGRGLARAAPDRQRERRRDRHHHADEEERRGGAQQSDHHAGQRRAGDAREVLRDRVEGDGVGERALGRHVVDEGLPRVLVHGADGALEDGEGVDDRHVDGAAEDERAERDALRGADQGRPHQHAAAVVAVEDHPDRRAGQQPRRAARRGDERQLRRRLAAEHEGEPVEADHLRPLAEARTDGADEQQAEVADTQRVEAARARARPVLAPSGGRGLGAGAGHARLPRRSPRAARGAAASMTRGRVRFARSRAWRGDTIEARPKQARGYACSAILVVRRRGRRAAGRDGARWSRRGLAAARPRSPATRARCWSGATCCATPGARWPRRPRRCSRASPRPSPPPSRRRRCAGSGPGASARSWRRCASCPTRPP